VLQSQRISCCRARSFYLPCLLPVHTYVTVCVNDAREHANRICSPAQVWLTWHMALLAHPSNTNGRRRHFRRRPGKLSQGALLPSLPFATTTRLCWRCNERFWIFSTGTPGVCLCQCNLLLPAARSRVCVSANATCYCLLLARAEHDCVWWVVGGWVGGWCVAWCTAEAPSHAQLPAHPPSRRCTPNHEPSW
jgi:hypothetical protein